MDPFEINVPAIIVLTMQQWKRLKQLMLAYVYEQLSRSLVITALFVMNLSIQKNSCFTSGNAVLSKHFTVAYPYLLFSCAIVGSIDGNYM